MGRVCCCWFLSYSPAIIYSNKCQLVSRSSVFIGGDSRSRPIASSMWWLDEACVQRLAFGFGGNFLSVSFVEPTGMVDLSNFISLSPCFVLRRIQICQGIFSSVSFRNFWSHLFLDFLDGLWWLVLCSHSQLTIMLFSLQGQSKQSN